MEVNENPLSKKSMREIFGLLGAAHEQVADNALAPEITATPVSFDSREQWGSCVHDIRDQQRCGSCWAFGASEALSDRFCIASNGAIDEVLSPQDMVSCDWSDMGCNGGWLGNAWGYLERTGIVTDSCFPYGSGDGNAPKCAKSCANG